MTQLFKKTVTPSIFYTEHCASIVPEAVPTVLEETTNTTFMKLGMSHYSGGDMILGRNSSGDYYDRKLFFGTTSNVYKTNTTGVYMIEAYLKFRSVVSYPVGYVHSDFRRGQKLEFLFNGFWSESSEKLCMVGSAPWYTSEGNILDLDAVLKLNYAKNKTISNILVSGVLESLSSADDPSYFDSISILALSKENSYKYTLVSEEFNQGNSGEIDYPPNSSLSLQPSRVCSMLTRPFTSYKVDYASKCISFQNCTSLGEEFGFSPNFMTLKAIDCSNDGQTIRYLLEFSKMSFVAYYKFLNPTRTLVAEASWDANKNRLSIVACRILNQLDPLESAHVGDCSIRMSLRYPAVWSIGNTVMTEGQIWTTKSADESGYFDRLKFQSYKNRVWDVEPSLKYEYTQMDRVRRSCPVRNVVNNASTYPSEHSYDIRIQFQDTTSRGGSFWGNAEPISVGHALYSPRMMHSGRQSWKLVEQPDTVYSGPVNISYEIGLTLLYSGKLVDSSLNLSLTPNGEDRSMIKISAEGVYDAATGFLCMIGCRNLYSHEKPTHDSMDCNILVKFQLPSLQEGGYVQGSIVSMREDNDPLYFDQLNLSAQAFYSNSATTQSVRRSRTDFKIIVRLVSNTLACVFVGLQLLYAKKHPDLLPLISLYMLVILSFGHIVPVVQNFQALLLRIRNGENAFGGSGGWLEVIQVLCEVIASGLLLSLLGHRTVWTQKLSDGEKKSLWASEKKAVLVSFAYGIMRPPRSYDSLVPPGFLLPQILLNIFEVSRERCLSPWFYLGMTFVGLVPQAYPLYIRRIWLASSNDQFPCVGLLPQAQASPLYIRRTWLASFNYQFCYNLKTGDNWGSWDAIFLCADVAFAGVIYMQQRFGGRCFLPRRFKKVQVSEKAPLISS
ncbi:hypothetical protein RJ640_004463 [Escallonia rubra]|uniref:RING-type E3 ubiquitin transferase n=1 Tax=Escallonia rubra TaxID=112253 RepID=A0AA88QHD8_9ASTE|nr:hypothetical protein RJ640_004463 [Escallonia rubra]